MTGIGKEQSVNRAGGGGGGGGNEGGLGIVVVVEVVVVLRAEFFRTERLGPDRDGERYWVFEGYSR